MIASGHPALFDQKESGWEVFKLNALCGIESNELSYALVVRIFDEIEKHHTITVARVRLPYQIFNGQIIDPRCQTIAFSHPKRTCCACEIEEQTPPLVLYSGEHKHFLNPTKFRFLFLPDPNLVDILYDYLNYTVLALTHCIVRPMGKLAARHY